MSNQSFNILDEKYDSVIPFPTGTAENPGVRFNFLTGVRVDPAPENNAYGCSLAFEFVHKPFQLDANGNVIRNEQGHPVFDSQNPSFGAKFTGKIFDYTANNETSEERVEKAHRMFMSNIKHVVGAFMTQEEMQTAFATEATGVEEFMHNIVAAFKTGMDKYSRIGSELKVVYNKKNYLKFPAVPPFISTSIKPKEFTTDPRYDFYEKQNVAPTNPAAAPGVPNMSIPNMPAVPNVGTPAPSQADSASAVDTYDI